MMKSSVLRVERILARLIGMQNKFDHLMRLTVHEDVYTESEVVEKIIRSPWLIYAIPFGHVNLHLVLGFVEDTTGGSER